MIIKKSIERAFYFFIYKHKQNIESGLEKTICIFTTQGEFFRSIISDMSICDEHVTEFFLSKKE